MSDDLEGNLIVNVPGDAFVVGNLNVPIVSRRNTHVNNKYKGVPFANNQNGRDYTLYYSTVVNDVNAIVPVLNTITNNLLSGALTGPLGDYVAAFIDVYTVDTAALGNNAYRPETVVHPSRYLATYTDSGTGDLDPANGTFAFDLTSFGLSDSTYVTVAVTYSKEPAASNVGQAVTGPTAAPISRVPAIYIRTEVDKAILWWFARPDSNYVEQTETLTPPAWTTFIDSTYTAGRNVLEFPFGFSSQPMSYFRLIKQ